MASNNPRNKFSQRPILIVVIEWMLGHVNDQERERARVTLCNGFDFNEYELLHQFEAMLQNLRIQV